MEKYYFINKFNENELLDLDNNINLIYRNNNADIEYEIKYLINFCKSNNKKIFLSNNLKLAQKFKIDGLYISAYNKKLFYKNIFKHKKFQIIGSAHNLIEIRIKKLQGCKKIFISPLFFNPKNKNYIDVIKFNFLTLDNECEYFALGGINKFNLNKLKLLNINGFGGISYFKKKALS